MSYQVLARKWRPKKFEEVVGQSHITRSLQNAVLHSKLGHAYLFSGTRGVGKTSVARIFAKAIRCPNRDAQGNPCSECSSCVDIDQSVSMDVIEMDGASNNKVEDIKNLLETIHTMPMFGDYKIYIVDEVHMLSNSAFNALLKTLEEPPSHVVFIFATTEPHKLLGTVLSRCQRFDFRHVSTRDLERHISGISEHEGIVFESEKLKSQICALGQGSVRDTLSILDQVLSYTTDKKVDEDILVTSLGLARSSALKAMVESIFVGDALTLSQIYQQLISENVDVHKITLGLLDQLYSIIEHIDNPQKLEQENLVDLGCIDGLNFAELFWIFETLNKDSEWATRSQEPVKTVEIILKKLAFRREFYAPEGAVIKFSSTASADQKKNEVIHSEQETPQQLEEDVAEQQASEEPSPAFHYEIEEEESVSEERLNEDDSCLSCGTPIIEAPSAETERNWENFLSFIDRYNPGGKARLEQGDISEEPQLVNGELYVELCYKSNCEIFYEHIVEPQTKVDLLRLLASFYEVAESNIHFDVKLLSKEVEENFSSRAEKKEAILQEEREQLKHNLKENDMLKKAEEMFNSKIDHIKLKD